jgi:hypothetical protein
MLALLARPVGEELELLQGAALGGLGRRGDPHHLVAVRLDAAAADPDAGEEGGEQAGQEDDESDHHLTVGQGDLVVAGLVVRFRHFDPYSARPRGKNAFIISMGSGKMIVEFFSEAISVNVWR